MLAITLNQVPFLQSSQDDRLNTSATSLQPTHRNFDSFVYASLAHPSLAAQSRLSNWAATLQCPRSPKKRSLEEEKNLMSKRPSVPRQESESTSHEPNPLTRTTNRSYGRPSEAQSSHSIAPRDAETTRSFRAALPPLSTLPGIPPANRSGQGVPRESGVRTILNPTDRGGGDAVSQPIQPHFRGRTDSPGQYQSQSQCQDSTSDPIRRPRSPPTSSVQTPELGSPRRPLITRAASFQGTTGHIPRSPSYSPYGHDRTVHTIMSHIPAVPKSPRISSQGYIVAPRAAAMPVQSRILSTASGFPKRSESASPSTTYSSYSQPSQTSPAEPMASQSRSRKSSYSQPPIISFNEGFPGSGMSGVPISDVDRTMMSSSSALSPSSYQLVTRETADGPVQFTVEVATGSRVADEKRKRNAGASARFRARRKEKEREATTRISELQQQINDLGEDAEFYRQERDYFSRIIFNGPDRDRHFPRPPSPRRQRMTHSQWVGLPPTAPQGFSQHQDSTEREIEGRHAKRRLVGYASQPNLLQTARVTQPAPHLPRYPQILPTQALSSRDRPQFGTPLGLQHPQAPELPQPPLSGPAPSITLPLPQALAPSGQPVAQQLDHRETFDPAFRERNREPPPGVPERR